MKNQSNKFQEDTFTIAELFSEKTNSSVFFNSESRPRFSKLVTLANSIGFDKKITTLFQKSTGLLYEGENKPGNVCFANNNEDMRDEFKQVFSTMDILYYVYGILTSKDNGGKFLHVTEQNPFRISYPKDAENFWQIVSKGKSLEEN